MSTAKTLCGTWKTLHMVCTLTQKAHQTQTRKKNDEYIPVKV